MEKWQLNLQNCFISLAYILQKLIKISDEDVDNDEDFWKIVLEETDLIQKIEKKYSYTWCKVKKNNRKIY